MICALVSFFCSALVSRCAKNATEGSFLAEFDGKTAVVIAFSRLFIFCRPSCFSSLSISFARSCSASFEGMIPAAPASRFVVVLIFV